MNLLSVEVENFRRFDRAHRVAGFGPGLNVLAGPNEHGKSTLLLALTAALFTKFDSRAAAIEAWRPRGHETAPRVAVEFAIGDIRARVEKRFLSRPFAHLVLDGRENGRFEGDAAEHRLRDMLGVEASEGRRLDLGLWDALWVSQGGSFAQAPLGGGRAAATVGACLAAELGAVTGGERGDLVLAGARASLAALRDGHGRPRGRAKENAEALATVVAEGVALAARAATLSEEIDELATHEDARAHLRALLDDGGTEDAIRAARAAREAALDRASRVDAARSAHRLATEQLAAADRARDERRAARVAAATADARAADASERSRQAGRVHDDAEHARRAAAGAVADAEAAHRTAIAAVRDARARLGRGEARALLASRAALLARARDAADALARADARRAAHRVTVDGVRALADAARCRDAAVDARDADAASIWFAPEPGAPALAVSVGGAPPVPLDRTPVAFGEDALVVVPGVGRVHVRPAGRDRAMARTRAADAERHLRSLLDGLGVASLAEADAALRRRDADEDAFRAARDALARLVPGDEAQDLAPGVAALASAVEALRLRMPASGDGDDDATAPETLAASLPALDAVERDGADRLASVRAAADRLERAASAAAIASAEARAGAEHARRRAEEERDLVARAHADAPDEALAAASDAARDRADDRLVALEALLREEADAPDAAMLRTRIDRLVASQAADRIEWQRLGERIAALRARIDEAGGSGLSERRDELARTETALRAERASLEREAASLDLLVRTLAEAVADARAVALGPLARHLAPHLSRLLPAAEARYGDDYAIDAIRRPGAAAAGDGEPFEQLSHGTREQVAILARLALAEMLHAAGKPAAMVLDDALVFSDAARIDRMFDILTDAATRFQVLVLTCREDLFRRLGGTRLRVEPADERR